MIEVRLENHGVICQSVHAAGVLEVCLRVPPDWEKPQRLALANLLAQEIEEVRIGCNRHFGATGELVSWQDGEILIHLTRCRVAGRWTPDAPPPLVKDVQVLLKGKEDEFRFILEAMIQAATDAPPGLIHKLLFNDPPAPPSGWKARVRQRCCARFEQANKDGRLVGGHGDDPWTHRLGAFPDGHQAGRNGDLVGRDLASGATAVPIPRALADGGLRAGPDPRPRPRIPHRQGRVG
jgi:hypothetical protein